MGEGELSGVIEPTGHEVAVVDEARLHRVANRHPEHQVTTAPTGQLGSGERHPEVVGGVARLRWCEEIVHEVHVADQHGVPEHGVDRVGATAADEVDSLSAELTYLVTADIDRTRTQG